MFGSAHRRVTHLFCADDLVLLAETAGELQLMLESLEGYSAAKGLTVNTSKSKVVVFNSMMGGTNEHRPSAELQRGQAGNRASLQIPGADVPQAHSHGQHARALGASPARQHYES